MDKTIRTYVDNIRSNDKDLQNKAYTHLLDATDQPVDWSYEVWDEMLAGLTHKDNHVRAISAQILSNLAKSDPKERMLRDFDKLLKVTKDERFVTARHCLQSLWKVGIAGKKQQKMYMDGLERRFKECLNEKNGSLIRNDILQSMRNVYEEVKEETIREKALELIDSEQDPKYRKKYASLWRK
ncbi:MAG TPA: hypothetical protein VHO49_00170 [Anaerolineales bacterium]|nr:hypothetical protein [Anaerolineales bacterium]